VGLPLAALLGGVLAAALVYALAWRRGIEGYRLVLVGVGVSAVGTALTNWLLTRAEITDAARATVWLTGSLNARGWEHVVPVGVALAVLVPVALLLGFGLGALQLGDDTARGLGLRVDRERAALILVAVALAAVATACAGPIAFVALVVPQICMRLAGSARPPLLTSAVYGALLMLVADLVARTVLAVELPVGIVTAVLGAPYLLFLLTRGARP
jgi:iron complex transport system permease protein